MKLTSCLSKTREPAIAPKLCDAHTSRSHLKNEAKRARHGENGRIHSYPAARRPDTHVSAAFSRKISPTRVYLVGRAGRKRADTRVSICVCLCFFVSGRGASRLPDTRVSRAPGGWIHVYREHFFRNSIGHACLGPFLPKHASDTCVSGCIRVFFLESYPAACFCCGAPRVRSRSSSRRRGSLQGLLRSPFLGRKMAEAMSSESTAAPLARRNFLHPIECVHYKSEFARKK